VQVMLADEAETDEDLDSLLMLVLLHDGSCRAVDRVDQIDTSGLLLECELLLHLTDNLI
jgi:hypothetical protein